LLQVLRQSSFVQKMTHLEWTKPGYFDAPEDEVVLQHAIARYHACVSILIHFICLPFNLISLSLSCPYAHAP
jgi:hypothetical protein